ncbi:hypothetical protein E4T43_08024 [Aureobasidium subglaciale]|nr:hypothetical protein E4T43_08024 [Aureobasidium subglaciale]
MPKVKETRVALKGENPKKAPKMSETLRPAPPHSEEVKTVSDSDESDSDSSSGHSSGSESDAEKRKNTKKPKASKVKETEPNSPPVPEDSSEEDSSDSDADLAAAVAKHKAGPAKNTPAAVTANGAALMTKATAKSNKSSEKVTESDDSSSEEESDSDVEMGEADKPAAAPRASGQAAEPAATSIVPPQPFNPPPGYKVLNTKSALAKTVNTLFDPSTISSKQIWHITAPTSVPLSDVKSVSLSAIQSHQTILSHDGTDYNLAEVPTNNARVLLPSSKSDAYTTVAVPVSKTLHLQQTIRLPNLSSFQTDPLTGSNAAANLKTPAISTPRPQPKGMRMRYKPPGFGPEDPGLIGSSEDESDANAKQTAKEARSKRKRDEKDAAEGTPKDKKRRKAAEAATKLTEGTRAEVPETAEEKARKKAEKKDKKKKDKK